MVAEQQGLETLLVDLDAISATASEWAAVREGRKPLVVSAQLADVEALSAQAKGEGFDLLILDCPPYFSEEVLGVIAVTDKVLIPVSPRFPELQSLPKFIDAIDHDYSLLLNTCCSDKDEKTIQMMVTEDLSVSGVHISRQDAFAEALNFGLGISEYEPDAMGAGQIRELLQRLVNNRN